jgi:hypothetical protein
LDVNNHEHLHLHPFLGSGEMGLTRQWVHLRRYSCNILLFLWIVKSFLQQIKFLLGKDNKNAQE